MKTIDTLVEDIYTLMKDRNSDKSVDVESGIDRFREAMKDIMRKEFLPSTKGRDGRKLRLSSVGKNDLVQWFSYNGYRGERIKPYTLIKFMYGHMIEEMLLLFTRLAGHEVTDEQKAVSVGGVGAPSASPPDARAPEMRSEKSSPGAATGGSAGVPAAWTTPS